MKLEITNEEKKVKVCFRKLRTFVLRAAKLLALPSKSEVGISFVSEKTIKELNKVSRKKDSVTDVLSFPNGSFLPGDIVSYEMGIKQGLLNPENDHIFLGDIVICTLRALEQATEFGHDLELEIYRLVVHSLLHLIGYDHENDEEYLDMHKREIEILKELGYNFSI